MKRMRMTFFYIVSCVWHKPIAWLASVFSGIPVFIPGKVIELHNEIIGFGSTMCKISGEKWNNSPKNLMARSVLYKLTETATIYHRAICALAKSGWASTAPVFLRALLDIYASVLFIAEKESNTRAAMYFNVMYMRSLQEPGLKTDQKKHNQEEINKTIGCLEIEEERQQAQRFVEQKKLGAYWFSAGSDYRSPSDILNKLSGFEFKDLYHILSGSVHGAFLGSAIFKDKPDEISVNPRYDRQSACDAICYSSAILLRIYKQRCNYESLGKERWSSKLFYGAMALAHRYGRIKNIRDTQINSAKDVQPSRG